VRKFMFFGCAPRHQIISALHAGLYGKDFAKTVGNAIFEELHPSDDAPRLATLGGKEFPIAVGVVLDPAEFNKNESAKFSSGSAIGGAFITLFEKTKASVDAKIAQLNESMEANPRYVGALGRVDTDGSEFRPPLTGLDFADITEKGANAWVATACDGAFRWGPSAAPLPGVATLLQAGSTTESTWVIVVQCAPILAQGIALKDVGPFLETASGKEFTKTCRLIRMSASEVLYVPFGSIAVPLFIDVATLEPAKRGAKKVQKTKSWTNFTFVPLFCTETARTLPGPVVSAVVQLNSEHFKTKLSEKLWECRKVYFDAFFAEVQKK
jgi:hypothetical protein